MPPHTRTNTRLLTITLASTLPLLQACSNNTSPESQSSTPPPSTWTTVALDDLTESQSTMHTNAMSAQSDLMQSLMKRLMTAMQESGPTGAINACNTDALPITDSVSTKHNLTIGRTSTKLRNPNNTPPTWSLPHLSPTQSPPAPIILSNTDGELALMNPITLAPQCLPCHGQSIDPTLQSTLDTLYPTDQATGYQQGDHRGWFWIHITPTP